MLRKEIKRKIITGLNERELVRLKFAKNDLAKKLKWKHSREFEFNGEMYDIVSVRKSSDSIAYYCWWDSEESVLNKKLIALVGLNLADLPENRELQFKLSNFYKNIFFQQGDFFEIYQFNFGLSLSGTDFYSAKSDFTKVGFKSGDSPPPEIL